MPSINTKSVRTYGRDPKPSTVPEKLDTRTKIYQTSQWHNMRKGYLQEHPCCEVHLINGQYIPAECVHHRKSFMVGRDEQEQMALAYSYGNLIALCNKCHNTIHAILQNTQEGTTTGQSALVIYNILSAHYKKLGSDELQNPRTLDSSSSLF